MSILMINLAVVDTLILWIWTNQVAVCRHWWEQPISAGKALPMGLSLASRRHRSTDGDLEHPFHNIHALRLRLLVDACHSLEQPMESVDQTVRYARFLLRLQFAVFLPAARLHRRQWSSESRKVNGGINSALQLWLSGLPLLSGNLHNPSNPGHLLHCKAVLESEAVE